MQALILLITGLAPSLVVLALPPMCTAGQENMQDSGVGLAKVSARAAALAVERETDAAGQMAAAKKVRSMMRGAKGTDRESGYWAAATAYAAVSVHWPRASMLLLMEAAFREGECWRVLGESGRAVGAFTEVCSLARGKGTDESGHFKVGPSRGLSQKDASARAVWHARAWLERGHSARRHENWPLALEAYAKALAVRGAPLRQKNDAREWMAKTHFKVANWLTAIESFCAWADQAETPAEKVRAVDGEARAWLGWRESSAASREESLARLSQAKKCLADLHAEMASLVRDSGKEGESVRKALARMVAPGLLAELEVNAAVGGVGAGRPLPATSRQQSP